MVLFQFCTSPGHFHTLSEGIVALDEFAWAKILQIMPVKPRPLQSIRNIRTSQLFLPTNNTLILLNQMFALK